MNKIDARLAQIMRFHSAARLEHNFTRLQEVGFSEGALREGTMLIQRALKLARAVEVKRAPSTLIPRVCAYQRRWFPVVRAALERHDSELAQLFFQGMVQLSRGRSLISVYEFLTTLKLLGNGAPPFGARGPAARALLAERTLTAQVEAAGWALMAEWGAAYESAPVGTAASTEVEAAVMSAWAWRDEWAALASVVIKAPQNRRALGLGARPRARKRGGG